MSFRRSAATKVWSSNALAARDRSSARRAGNGRKAAASGIVGGLVDKDQMGEIKYALLSHPAPARPHNVRALLLLRARFVESNLMRPNRNPRTPPTVRYSRPRLGRTATRLPKALHPDRREAPLSTSPITRRRISTDATPRVKSRFDKSGTNGLLHVRTRGRQRSAAPRLAL